MDRKLKKIILVARNVIDSDSLTLPTYVISRVGNELFQLGQFDVDDGYLIACATDIKEKRKEMRVSIGDMSVGE
jgi:hypothetical protein